MRPSPLAAQCHSPLAVQLASAISFVEPCSAVTLAQAWGNYNLMASPANFRSPSLLLKRIASTSSLGSFHPRAADSVGAATLVLQRDSFL